MIVKKVALRKSGKHSSAGNLCRYLFGPGRKGCPDRARVLGGTLLGQTARALTAELNALAANRPNIRNPFVHWVIAPHPDDREVTDQEALELGSDLAWTFNVSNWSLISHREEVDGHGTRKHWHWIGSRVDELGVLAPNLLRDYSIAMRFARKWVRFLGLQELPSPVRPDRPHGRVHSDRITDRADLEAKQRGEPLIRDRIRSILDSVETLGLKGRALRLELLANGLELDLRMAGNHPKGVTFILNGQARYKGSALGKRYGAKAWLSRNHVFIDLEGTHGEGTNGIHEAFPIVDSSLDDHDRLFRQGGARAKPGRPRNALGMGTHVENAADQFGAPEQVYPEVAGAIAELDRASAAKPNRLDGSIDHGAHAGPEFDLHRRDEAGSPVYGGTTVFPDGNEEQPVGLDPMGQTGPPGDWAVHRGVGEARSEACGSVGVGGLEAGHLGLPGGLAGSDPTGSHPSQCPGSGINDSQLGRGRRR